MAAMHFRLTRGIAYTTIMKNPGITLVAAHTKHNTPHSRNRQYYTYNRLDNNKINNKLLFGHRHTGPGMQTHHKTHRRQYKIMHKSHHRFPMMAS